MNDNQRRSAHFLNCLGVLEKIHPIRGGTPESPFTVLEVAPSAAASGHKRVGYTYITNGMSARPQPCEDAYKCAPGVNIEVMIYSRKQSGRALAILEELANFPFDARSCLARGQVLPTDDASDIGWAGYALFAPHREDSEFSPLPFKIEGCKVHVLWVYPLLPIEVEYGTRFGGQALEEIVQVQSARPFLDHRRKAMVKREDFDRRERETRERASLRKATERRKPLARTQERRPSRRLFGLASIFSRDRSEPIADQRPEVEALPTPGAAPIPARQSRAESTGPGASPPPAPQPADVPGLPASYEEARDAVAAAAAREIESLERLRQLETELQSAREGLEKAREESRAAESEREATNAKLRAFLGSLERVEKELAGEVEALASAREDLDAAQSLRDTIARELVEARKRRAAIDEKRLELECELESDAERRKQIEECRQSMEAAVRDATAEAEAAEAHARELRRQAEELQRQAEEATRQAADARTATEEAQLELEKDAGELQALHGKDEQLKASIVDLEKEVARLEEELEERNTALEEKDAEIEKFEKQIAPDSARHARLVDQKGEIQREIDSAGKQLEEFEKTLRAYHSTKSSAAVLEQKFDRKIKDALDAFEIAREQHARLRKHCEELEAIEMQHARAEAEAAAAKVAEMQRALDMAKQEAELKLKEIEAKSKKLRAVSDADASPASKMSTPVETGPGTGADAAPEEEPVVMKVTESKAGIEPAQRQQRATARMERLQIIKQSMMNQKEDRE